MYRYGWFWECPKGPNCKYRHILPEGFVLESEKKALKAAEKKNQISLEDLIERERAALGPNQTKITLETFSVWKAKKKAEKKAAREKEIKEKTKKAKAGQVKGLTGKIFEGSTVCRILFRSVNHYSLMYTSNQVKHTFRHIRQPLEIF